MIRFFLVPMSEPPYSRENPQRPLFTEDLLINWTGIPLKNAPYYLIKAACHDDKVKKLDDLQASPGVIDFPNVLTDDNDKLPKARLDKNKLIKDVVGIVEAKDKKEKVGEFIDRVREKGGAKTWDKNAFVPED